MNLGVIIKFGGAKKIKLMQTVLSILQGGVNPGDIIIVGSVKSILNINIINQCTLIESAAASKGALGSMINLAVKKSRSEYLLICDDDIFFPDLFFDKLKLIIFEKFDVLSFGIMNTDGSRYWDSAIHGIEHQLVPFGWHSTESYLTGGAFVAKRKVLITIPFSEDLLIGEGEDVEWSKRLVASGFFWYREYGLQVIHNDGQCYQKNNVVEKSFDTRRLIKFHRGNYTRGEVFIDNTTLNFSEHKNVMGLMLNGWHEPESWGVWASAASSLLKFNVRNEFSKLTIKFRIPDFIEKKNTEIRVFEITSGDFYIGNTNSTNSAISLSINNGNAISEYKPVILFFDNSSFINKRVTLDSRILGIGIEKIELWHAQS